MLRADKGRNSDRTIAKVVYLLFISGIKCQRYFYFDKVPFYDLSYVDLFYTISALNALYQLFRRNWFYFADRSRG